ncbi:protein mono-ADP-ribosyltransferase PARP12-like [Stigmatopora nigra]
MSDQVSNLILSVLCDEQGSLPFQDLLEKLSQKVTVAKSILHKILADDEIISIQKGVLPIEPDEVLSLDSVLVAKTSLRICQKKPDKCTTPCGSLHLCKFYVLETCVFGTKCKQPHSINIHNAELLKKLDLQNLSEKQLFQLLLQNDPYLLPEICSHYNLGEGVNGLCNFSSKCHKLHICKSYITTGICKQGSSCSRTHQINAEGHRSFVKFSLGFIMTLPKIYKNKCIIMGDYERASAAASGISAGLMMKRKPVSDSDKLEICLFFLKNLCTYNENCVRQHWQLPYRWQVLESSSSWKDLNDMEVIEKAYCDPAKESNDEYQRTPRQLVDFIGMICNDSHVRRLSSPSSVTKSDHFILTTRWIWYWKALDGQWHEFEECPSNTETTITSKELENKYMENQKGQVAFSDGEEDYVIRFSQAGTQRMYQENINSLTRREVRRRPYFVSPSDMKALLEKETKDKRSAGAHSDAHQKTPVSKGA